MTKSHVRPDIKTNRLYIKVVQKLTKQELDSLYTDIRFGAADLSPGFSVITDLSECYCASLNGVATFKKIADFLIENHVGTVVRVMNDNSIVFRQFINFTSRTQGYNPINVSTLEEAEAVLEQAVQRSSPRFRLHQQPVVLQSGETKYNGLVVDISTSGCAVKADAPLPPIGEELSMQLSFSAHQELESQFDILSKVVKSEKSWFAVHYISLDDEVKQQLSQRLLHESKSALSL